ncbi:MAG TPA: WbqC family protein [Thermoanaerobaculia bacterium]|nr:WbqC family protein [Thermoanaerobaculia bacterium]
MIACVHQPNFLPWLGFFAKLAASDVYIVMDNVQFPRNSFVNRVRVGGSSPAAWLTVPTRHAGRLELRIDEVEINWESDWTRKHVATLRQRYARSAWIADVLDPIEQILARRYRLLAEQNLELVRFILQVCGIERRIVRGSELHGEGANSALIVSMCKTVGATTYLAGQGAADYEDLGVYAAAGIAYRRTSFVHPVYAQRGGRDFAPGLSILDALLNAGPERTSELVRAGV